MSTNWTGFESAIKAWRDIVGEANVKVESEELKRAETTTFQTSQQIPAIILPSKREEIQAIVRIANEYKIPLYTVSSGKNWGYGGQVPVQERAVLLNLSRMNRILDFDEKLAYVTVEPGVTYEDLNKYLAYRVSKLASVWTGGPATGSIIGNVLERGFTLGSYIKQVNHVAGFEVVLGTGEFIRTGFGRFGDLKIAKLDRWGVGPSLDGLFSQSNFGIVTALTIWLQPAPERVLVARAWFYEPSTLSYFLDDLQPLVLRNVFYSPFIFYNDIKEIASRKQFPWNLTETTPLPEIIRDKMRGEVGAGKWMGFGMLSLMSGDSVEERKAWLQNQMTSALSRALTRPLAFQELKLEDSLRAMPENRIMTAYWRKRAPIPENMDPERDRCGLLWVAPVYPFLGEEVYRSIEEIDEIVHRHGFEPHLSAVCSDPRIVNVLVGIVFDREVKGEDEKALACQYELHQKLSKGGYLPYRVGINTTSYLPATSSEYEAVFQRIKQAVDPLAILSSGRYEVTGKKGA